MPCVMVMQGIFFTIKPFRLVLWSLVYEIHELVKLRSDDDLSAAVLCAASISIIVSYRVVFSTTTCCEASRVHAVLVLKFLNDRAGTEC